MHLVFVESGYPHPHGGGGAGTYVQLIAQELIQRGHRISVVTSWCSLCPSQYDDKGVTVYRPKHLFPFHYYANKLPVFHNIALILKALERNILLYRVLEQLHRCASIDLVEFTEGGDFFHAWRTTFPYIVHLHGSRYTFLAHSGQKTNRADWYHRKLELAFIRRASFIVSPSQALLDIVRQEAGGLSVPGQVIPYPIDPRILPPDGLQSVGNAKKVLFAARNDPVKGAIFLLAAVPFVRQQVPDVEFHFFGFEPKPDQLIPEGVVLHPFVSKDELMDWYQQVDICVVPSLWDNSPNTVYEAMAAGVAMVASRVGGIPELVIHGETGLLIAPNDVLELQKALLQLLTNTELRRKMGIAARQRAVTNYNLSDNITRRESLYYKLTKDNS